MTSPTVSIDSIAWFRALLDSAPEVFFRYSLESHRFVYVSPSIEQMTGRPAVAFLDDANKCLELFAGRDRRTIRQVLRARREVSVSLTLMRGDVTLPLDVRAVPVMRARTVIAIEGVARLAEAVDDKARRATTQSSPSDPIGGPVQQRLTSLLVEVHSLLHHALPVVAPKEPLTVLRVGALTFDEQRLAVKEGETPIELTARELMLLRYLLKRPGRIVTRQQLLADVWSYRYDGDDRTVDVHVSRLRKKLPSLKERLVAVKGLGYCLEVDGADADRTARIANC